MRENESAAEAIGKNLLYMKVAVFAFSAGLAAVAGSLFARYLNFVGVESFGIDETIYMLAMVILGGTGNLWGSLIGAAILVILPELLKFVTLPAEIADKSHLIIYGLLLIAILRLRPEGLLGERSTMRHLPHVDEAIRPGAPVTNATAEGRSHAVRPRPASALRRHRRRGRPGHRSEERLDHRPDRTERRRQDHRLQPVDRLPLAGRRQYPAFAAATLPG